MRLLIGRWKFLYVKFSEIKDIEPILGPGKNDKGTDVTSFSTSILRTKKPFKFNDLKGLVNSGRVDWTNF